ncbi:MAG: hypothetical protein JSV65_02365 [Armatimonadota bacterium]|nr:MAG: hypothetical protein JSV65_02365 [Armatimonadota bacterium]
MRRCLLAAALLILMGAAVMTDEAQRKLPETPQLFVDLERVANAHPSGRAKRMRGVERVFHQAVNHPHPVLAPEAAWERRGFTCSVIYDAEERSFKMWYLTALEDGRHVTCYAVSEDGINWRRPELGLHEYQGSTANNIVIPADYHDGMAHWESVLRDPLERDPARRYKALGWSSYDWDGPLAGIYTAVSGDGLRWTHTPEPVFRFHPRPGSDDLGPVGDAHCLMIDTLRNRYVAFLRHLPHRAISYSTDFAHWTQPETFLWTRHYEEEFYNNSGFVYSDQYLGLLSIFDLNPKRHELNCWLMSSRDGRRWERCPADAPVIACGGAGEWSRFMSWNGGSPPIRVGDRLYFYYRGSARRHGPYEGEDNCDAPVCVGLATLRADGFASLNASFDGGEVITTPWVIDGGELLLNAKCDYGEICVELLDEAEQPVPGYALGDCIPVRGDGTDLAVRWKERADLSAAAGKTVSLRVHLKNARLYSYRCGK